MNLVGVMNVDINIRRWRSSEYGKINERKPPSPPKINQANSKRPKPIKKTYNSVIVYNSVYLCMYWINNVFGAICWAASDEDDIRMLMGKVRVLFYHSFGIMLVVLLFHLTFSKDTPLSSTFLFFNCLSSLLVYFILKSNNIIKIFPKVKLISW